MAVQICPNSGCKAQLNIPDKCEGKKVKCPKCTFIFMVKMPPTPPAVPPVIDLLNGFTHISDTRVFISHSVLDKAFVDSKVQHFFRSHNIATWICSEDIAGGALFQQNIMDGLNRSDWFVLVLSPRSVESESVRQEVELAFETKRGRILPILMEQCDIKQLHPDLSAIQYEDFTDNVDLSQRHLLVSMVRQLNKERNELEQTAEHQRQTIEALRTENADIATRRRELEGMVRRAASFDGQWSEGGGGGNVPVFVPMKTRGVPIVAVCNLKGGVGKTTLTANLGATLWGEAFRKRVLLMDLDYQGSLSTICLDAAVRSKLTKQQRFVQEVFKLTKPDGKLIIKLANPVMDHKTKNHQAEIIAADEELARAEGEVLGRWMMQDTGIDGRFLLRQELHPNAVQQNLDIVLIDCPPRMTAAGINGFLAADFVLIPTPLEEVSTEAVPRLLRWVRERREKLLSNLDVLGVVVSRLKQANGTLQEHEKELLIRLKDECNEAWGGPVTIFDTCIPAFPADANNHQYPAQHAKLRGYFGNLLNEMMPALVVNPARPAKPVKANK